MPQDRATIWEGWPNFVEYILKDMTWFRGDCSTINFDVYWHDLGIRWGFSYFAVIILDSKLFDDRREWFVHVLYDKNVSFIHVLWQYMRWSDTCDIYGLVAILELGCTLSLNSTGLDDTGFIFTWIYCFTGLDYFEVSVFLILGLVPENKII